MNTIRHADDAMLLRLLDHELADDAAEALRVHVATCLPCRDRLAALERRDERVRAWLEAHDDPPPARGDYHLGASAVAPARRPAPRRWLTAASIVLAVAVAAGPARGWILERVGLTSSSTVDAPTAAATASTSFLPRSSTLLIDLVGPVSSRRVVVERSEDALVHVIAPDDAAELLVRPSGIRLVDATQGGRTYRLSLPASVSQLRIVHEATALDTLVTLTPRVLRQVIDLGGGD